MVRASCPKCGQAHTRCAGHPTHGPLRPCMAWPPAGGKVCWKHGGAAKAHLAKARRTLALAKVSAEMSRLGVGIEVDPADALLAMVYESAGAVSFLRSEVAALATHPTLRHVELVDDDGEATGHSVQVVTPGLYGPDHLGDARRHILVSMYDAERSRLAGFCRLAIAGGVEERRVTLAERQAGQIAGVIMAVLDALDLSAAQREVGRRVAAEQLRLVTAA